MRHMANITDLVPAGELTEKQFRFCGEYLIDLNATKAAIRAGYSKDTAHSIGWENLQKPEISRVIKAMREKTAQDLGITREDVIRKFMQTADQASEGTPVLEYDPEEKRMMPSGEWQFDGKTVHACWVSIAKILGYLDNKTTGGDGVTGLNLIFISHMAQLEAKKQGITIEGLKKEVSQSVSRGTENAST